MPGHPPSVQLGRRRHGHLDHPRRRRRLRPAQAGLRRHRPLPHQEPRRLITTAPAPRTALQFVSIPASLPIALAGADQPCPCAASDWFSGHVGARNNLLTESERATGALPGSEREEVSDARRPAPAHRGAVLFDEHHGEAWSIRPEAAARMRPTHPAAASYARAAAQLAERDFEVATRHGRPLDDRRPRGGRRPRDRPPVRGQVGAHGRRRLAAVLSAARVAAVETVRRPRRRPRRARRGRGGQVRRQPQRVLAPYGLRLENDDGARLSSAPASRRTGSPGVPAPGSSAPELLHRVRDVGFYRAGIVAADEPGAIVLRTSPGGRAAGRRPPCRGEPRRRPRGGGRGLGPLRRRFLRPARPPAALAQPRVLGVHRAPSGRTPRPIVSEAAQDPAWLRLKDATDALRLLQGPNGAIDLARHDSARCRRATSWRWSRPSARWRRGSRTRASTWTQVLADLDAWVDGGCGKPDFRASLDLFRPDLAAPRRHRAPRRLPAVHAERLARTPASRRSSRARPWPDFVARIERELYDNDKFVPVQLVDNTAGYDSECAVLFPETVSVADRPTNHFGGIFCDRESARFRRSALRGAEAAAHRPAAGRRGARLVRGPRARDLRHLGHDPRPLAQPRRPAVRPVHDPPAAAVLDVLARGAAGRPRHLRQRRRAVREGFPFARYVQYAILFDRILRFPITGNRVRNYDGLGGQLLFGFLHQSGVVRWTDNRLTIDWERSRTAWRAARARRGALPARHRHEQGVLLGRGPRPVSRIRGAQPRLGSGARTRA